MQLAAGLKVEWRNSFRDFIGVVVRSRPGQVEVYEFMDMDIYEFPAAQQHILVPIGTAVPELVKYLRKEHKERIPATTDAGVHVHVISQLSSSQTDNTKLRIALLDAIDEEKKALARAIKAAEAPVVRKKVRRVRKPLRKLRKASAFKASAAARYAAQGDEKDGKDDYDDMAGKSCDDYEDDFEDCEEEDDEEGEDEEEGGDEEDSDEEEDDDEEEDKDEGEDTEDEEEEESEAEGSGSEDSEEEDEDDDHPKINIKVFVMPQQDTRGYTLRLNKSGLKKMQRKLASDYGAGLQLFFRDEDGDAISIRTASDLVYAQRSNGKGSALKLFADHSHSHGKAVVAGDTAEEEVTAVTAHTTDGFDVLWKKGDLLGTGSFGKVFAGINLSNGERMAVKEVSFGQDKKSILQARALQREVQILSSLQHLNIVRYIGTEMSGNTLRIFLEFATDGTLKDAVQEFGPLPEPLLRHYTVDILDGLSYLHDLKMIHRDIKPANLLISNGVVKLADFGCSSANFNDGGSETDHFTVVGTTIYMAPEVMQAGEDNRPDSPVDGQHSLDEPDSSSKRTGYGRKADIWSLGMTLYELSTGNSPYKSAAAAIYAVCVSKKVPAFPTEFSDAAHSFLSRCLEIDPAFRASAVVLREHPFCTQPGLEEARAQTAASLSRSRAVNWSTVKVNMPTDFSFSDTKHQDVQETGFSDGSYFSAQQQSYRNGWTPSESMAHSPGHGAYDSKINDDDYEDAEMGSKYGDGDHTISRGKGRSASTFASMDSKLFY